MESSPEDFLQHGNVRFSERGAAEMDRSRALVFIPHGEIERIAVGYASGAERPIVTIILAIGLLALALSPIVLLTQAIRHGGTVEIHLLTPVAFAVPGLWLARLAFKKRWIILVHTRRGVRRLIVQGDAESAELESFVGSVKARFGYS